MFHIPTDRFCIIKRGSLLYERQSSHHNRSQILCMSVSFLLVPRLGNGALLLQLRLRSLQVRITLNRTQLALEVCLDGFRQRGQTLVRHEQLGVFRFLLDVGFELIYDYQKERGNRNIIRSQKIQQGTKCFQ